MNTKTVSQLDAQGYFVAPTQADESPLEPGVFLIPGGCADAPPPTIPQGKRARWDGAAFVLEDIPAPPAPVTPPPPTRSELVAIVLAKAKAQRLTMMSILDGMQVSALVNNDTPTAQAIEAAKQGLRNITNTDLSACNTQAEMELAIYQAYLAIAAAAPASVQSAFQSLVP